MNLDLLNKYILENWKKLFPDLEQPVNIRWLVSYSPYGKHCKAEILLFPDTSPIPIARCKYPILDSDEFIDCERKMTVELKSIPGLADSIPRIIDLPRIEENKVWMESFQEGIPFKKYLQDNQNQMIPKITDWLVNLHSQTHQMVVINPDWMKINILQPLNKMSEIPGNPGTISEESIDYIGNIIQSFSGKSLPLCLIHNDLRVSKITVLAGNKFYIVDWELSERSGYPLTDLLFLITDAISLQHNISFNKSVEYLLTDRVSSVYKNAIQYYLKKVNMDTTWLPALILLFGINRVELTRKIILPIQSFDGIEWAKNSISLLNNMVILLKSNQCKLL